MATRPVIQQFVNENADPGLQRVFVNDAQSVPATAGNSSVFITNVNEITINNISSPGEPAGNSTEVQFNFNGRMDGDDGLTYNPTTDSLNVLGNLTANILLTNNLYYSNGSPWVFSGSTYSNTNVGAYLSSYSGNITASKVTSSLFVGSGANLTNVPAGNITGTVANASHATVSNSANSVSGSNVTGAVANASHATIANSANSVAGANVTGTVSLATSATSATTAGTVTTAAQPNITSVGSLTGLTVSNSTGVVNFTTTANVTLGAVGNLHISGGTSGQVLSTDGSGTLSWTTPSVSTPNLYTVTNAGSTTNVALSITNTTDSLSFSTGAVTISGGIGVAKAIHTDTHVAAKNTIYAGQYADFSSWVVPKFIGRDAGSTYIQGALINTNANGSADWVAYNDASPTDGSEGWTDMGYTGSTFSDPLYTITKANDGYVFTQGINATDGGNFVLATGALGEHHDLVFATGGFLEANEAMRLDHERNIFFVGGHAHTGLSDRVIDLDVNGNIIVSGNINGDLSASPAPSINDFSSAEFVDSLTVGNITISNNLINTNSSATSLLLSANYPASSNALIEIPNFLDGGEKLTIRNDFTNSNGIDIQTSGGIWTFSATGNLVLPGNTFSVNYANGTQVSLGGGGSSISNGTSNVTVTSTDGNVVIGVDNDVMSWTFAMDGNIYSKSENDLTLVASDPNGDSYKVKQVVTDGSVELSRTSLEDGQFSIYTNLDSTAEEWRFSGNTLQVTNNSTVRAFGSNVAVESMYTGSGNGTASLRSVSNSNDPNIFTTFDATTTGANITIYNGGSNGGTGYTWSFDNNGNLTVPGHIVPDANIAYDLGNSTNRFRDLYLSGTTIDLGGTLIQAQSNGEVTIGNATFSSSGTISAADVSIGVTALNANTTAILGHAGSMLTYGNVGGGILYSIPNNATTSFAVGSRIELLALSQATIIVEPSPGSGVTLITSKDLNTNNPTLSNIQSAKLTKIGTDTWYLGL